MKAGRLKRACQVAGWVWWAGAAAAQPWAAQPAAATATQAASEGREAYERGSLRGQPLTARTGADGSWVLRGAAVACANCHGLAGTGGGEGYLRAPDLRWPQWLSPDAAQQQAARTRLRAALQQGRGQDGRLLGTAMPRFDLDDASFDALASHLQGLSTSTPFVQRPRLAVLALDDGQQGATERATVPALLACLRQRLAGRADIDVATVASAAAARAQWRDWQAQGNILAVLAPPWRGWRPPLPDAGTAPLAALYPLVADPDTFTQDAPPVHWLFGGVEARAAALIQAWLQAEAGAPTGAQPGAPLQTPAPSQARLPVWLGAGARAGASPAEAAPPVQAMLERIAQVVLRDTGRQVRWQLLPAPQWPGGSAGLWLDAQRPPTGGWWLLPHGANQAPAAPGRWWVAAPFAGQPARPLAQRWADATCRTAEAAIDSAQPLQRNRWAQAVANTARLRDGQGWEWHVPALDAYGYGASTAWTVVELSAGAPPLPVAPQVNIGRPAEELR